MAALLPVVTSLLPKKTEGRKMAEKSNADILYTIVDEAPELASASFLPIIRKFASAAGVTVGTKDI
jgi:hypothetical protein